MVLMLLSFIPVYSATGLSLQVWNYFN